MQLIKKELIKDYYINPLTLVFVGDDGLLEQSYSEAYNDHTTVSQTQALIFGAIMYLLLTGLDIAFLPEKAMTFFVIRAAIVLLLSLLIRVLMVKKLHKKYAQIMLTGMSLLVASSIIYMHFQSVELGYGDYRYSLLLLLIYIFLFSKLRFIYVVVVSFMIIASYNLVELLIDRLSSELHFDSNMMLIITIALGLVVVYRNEMGNRLEYCLQCQKKEAEQPEVETDHLDHTYSLDPLTGLYNRQYLEVLRRQQHFPLTFVMADVNGLKYINDHFSHQMGDRYLIVVAEILKKVFKKATIIRLSGDEFLVVCYKASENEILGCIGKVKSIAEQYYFEDIQVSISLGYALKLEAHESIESVYKRAEDHMYQKKIVESPSMQRRAIDVIIKTLHEKNIREAAHSHRVSTLAKILGTAFGLSNDKVKELELMGLLHDIGKIAIDEAILNKEGKLTELEYEFVKSHPEVGYRILNVAPEMIELSKYVLYHHERWDGKGYPTGLKGNDIPLQSRIIAIVDAFDAMTSERAYRQAKTTEYAVGELRRYAGVQFDPELVELFCHLVI